MLASPRGTVGERLGQVQTHVGFQFQPHTDRLYCAVDSITASSTPCSRSQINNRCRSLGMVANRRRSGFSSGVVASLTTTISTFLCTSIPAILYDIASSWRGSGRTRARKVTHPHVLPPFPPGWVARHRLVQKRTFQIKLIDGLTSSRVQTNLCRPRMIDRTRAPTLPNFHVDGWAAGPYKTHWHTKRRRKSAHLCKRLIYVD